MSERTTWQRVARRIRVPLGFVFAAVFLWLARPTGHSMLWSLLLVVPGVWLRGFASGYVRKNTELATTGPYAHTRNPLYLGSMMIAFGFAAAAWSWIILVALAVLFTIIYLPTIRSEEAYLRGAFAGFDAYAAQVPRLLPRITPAHSDAERGQFSPALYRQHREYNCGVGAIAIYVALVLRLFWIKH
ncbi:MAG: isoprenylcysteine carboxylmethyltransferase family protein [Granulicella sp.]